MPEGDTVWRTARRLHETLAGEVISAADLRWPGISTADLRGMRTLEVVARGKNVLHRLDAGLTLHSHLRMEGQWRIESTDLVAARTLANRGVATRRDDVCAWPVGSALPPLRRAGARERARRLPAGPRVLLLPHLPGWPGTWRRRTPSRSAGFGPDVTRPESPRPRHAEMRG